MNTICFSVEHSQLNNAISFEMFLQHNTKIKYFEIMDSNRIYLFFVEHSLLNESLNSNISSISKPKIKY